MASLERIDLRFWRQPQKQGFRPLETLLWCPDSHVVDAACGFSVGWVPGTLGFKKKNETVATSKPAETATGEVSEPASSSGFSCIRRRSVGGAWGGGGGGGWRPVLVCVCGYVYDYIAVSLVEGFGPPQVWWVSCWVRFKSSLKKRHPLICTCGDL